MCLGLQLTALTGGCLVILGICVKLYKKITKVEAIKKLSEIERIIFNIFLIFIVVVIFIQIYAFAEVIYLDSAKYNI